MDQDAFRNLLSAPRPSAGGSSSRGVLGAPAPKRGWGLKAKEGYEKKKEDKPPKPEFAPRKYHKREPPPELAYKDRAALRREGRNDEEYENVSKLLEDFEKRKAEARRPEEIEELEKQRAYLGGDVEHSVLVKGLDYALLAARKAELAKQKGEEIDDELDVLQQGLGKREEKEGKTKEEKVESLGKGFKSIAQKKAEADAAANAKGEKKKKKKKKKVKPEAETGPQSESIAGPSTAIKSEVQAIEVDQPQSSKKAEQSDIPSVIGKAEQPAPPSDDDEDIFGDVGEYDLGAAAPESDSDSEDEAMDVDPPSRGRSRTRSPVDRKDGLRPRSPGYRHDRSRSRSRSRSGSRSYDRRRSSSRSRSYDRRRPRSRSHSRSNGYRDRSPVYESRRRRSSSYDRERRRSPSPYRRRYRDRSYPRDRSRSRSRSPYYSRRRSRSPSPYYSRRKSPSPRRGTYRARSRSRSPPSRRRYDSKSISRSPTPPRPIRERSYSRSPTPLLHEPIRSPSISDDEDDEQGPGRITKLQPLSSSAIPSLKNFLQAENEAAQAEEKRMKKAKWRAQQGLSAQEGASELLASEGNKKEGGEKQKANREYQLLMNRMNKGESKDKDDNQDKE
ncbi:hypothetical protein I204_06875 [Kwoniella mangroviensis CBS 8886]|uniref:uncharacterized protein n=1 Tax=Kwoniella mangroviensis CBS 8507 TaxID=1296122 RepID=UPI00080D474E|nr:uncharacterized protein I203_01154 [Kwoniella mangroviensis CBS 8507]OCF69299.1 hypothetical protein I203_01154 [Kwoniella mangroviensis CBS 8507]OCF72494.1 hypothetical protein I204_06875 [Kwoniella mangroviensis CBS 8886]